MVYSEAMGTGFNDPGGAASSGSSSGELPSVPATLVNKHNLDVRWEGSLWSPRKRPANLKSNKVQNMELRHVDVFAAPFETRNPQAALTWSHAGCSEFGRG